MRHNGPRPKPRLCREPAAVDGARWVPLTKERFALVDEADFALVSSYNWYLGTHSNPDAITRRRGAAGDRKISMHRLLLNAPTGVQVDHINGNPLDNRRCNLRLCAPSENVFNTRRRIDNKSGFKGVSRCARGARVRWQAHIHAFGKHYVLGRFDTPEAAHEAYKRAALRLHGEFANFGEGPVCKSA